MPTPGDLGYPVLAVLVFGESAGLPIPGETALLTAGALAATGHLALPLVILTAAVAAVAGDTVGYWLGRRGGRAFLLRDGFMAGHRRHAVRRADLFFARYGTLTVFAGRWLPGVRVVAAVLAGAALMPWRRFAVANAAGAVCWAATVAGTAALVGPAGTAVIVVAGMLVAVAGFLVARRRAAVTMPDSSCPRDRAWL